MDDVDNGDFVKFEFKMNFEGMDILHEWQKQYVIALINMAHANTDMTVKGAAQSRVSDNHR